MSLSRRLLGWLARLRAWPSDRRPTAASSGRGRSRPSSRPRAGRRRRPGRTRARTASRPGPGTVAMRNSVCVAVNVLPDLVERLKQPKAAAPCESRRPGTSDGRSSRSSRATAGRRRLRLLLVLLLGRGPGRARGLGDADGEHAEQPGQEEPRQGSGLFRLGVGHGHLPDGLRAGSVNRPGNSGQGGLPAPSRKEPTRRGQL